MGLVFLFACLPGNCTLPNFYCMEHLIRVKKNKPIRTTNPD